MNFLKGILKSPTLRTFGVFAGGNFLVAVLGGVGGLLQARWIAPEVFGEFRKYGILTAYLNIGLVFVHDGLIRQFPYLIGKGDKEEALRFSAAAKWWYLVMSWCFSVFFVCATLVSLSKGDLRAAVGWGAQIAYVWVAFYGAYLSAMYRTSSDFKRLSYNRMISGTISFCAIIIVKILGYWGLAVRFILQSVAGVFIDRRYLPVKTRAVFDGGRLLQLAKMSLPISIPGYIQTSCLGATMSFVVLKYCGQSGLGIYGIALTFQGMAMTFTAALNQMFITKITCKFGETDNVFSCLKYVKTPTLLSVGVATILAVGMCIAINPFISLLLPKYVAAIPVIRVLAVSIPLQAAGLPLIVFRSALWYKSVTVRALAQFSACMVAVTILPKTLIMIAMCLLLGEICSLVVGYSILVWKRFRRSAVAS